MRFACTISAHSSSAIFMPPKQASAPACRAFKRLITHERRCSTFKRCRRHREPVCVRRGSMPRVTGKPMRSLQASARPSASDVSSALIQPSAYVSWRIGIATRTYVTISLQPSAAFIIDLNKFIARSYLDICRIAKADMTAKVPTMASWPIGRRHRAPMSTLVSRIVP